MARSSYVTVTDMFCGAGGSSIGVVAAGAELTLGLNHWALAIETHSANFPRAEHVLTDIRTADPRRFPTTDVLIASPSCTAHALAKGRPRKNIADRDLWGATGIDPAEEKSRCTMWDVPRFAERHNYRICIVENVVDARLYWRPFDAWLAAMASLGYDHQLVCFNSMFAHPTPQSRDRLYIVFWQRKNRRPNLRLTPTAWCPMCRQDVGGVQSWKNPARPYGKYGPRAQYLYCCPRCAHVVHPYYYAAAHAIDWSIRGQRIGDRARPLKDKTLERIRHGLHRFAGMRQPPAGAILPFIAGLEHGGEPGRVYPVHGVWPTQTTQQDRALVTPPFLVSTNYFKANRAIEEPLPTQVTDTQHALVCPPYLMGMHGDSYTFREQGDVLPTQVASGSTTALVCPPLLLGQQSESRARPADRETPTVSTAGAISLVESPRPFLFSYYGGRHATHDLDEAHVTMAARDNHALVTPPLMVPLRNHGTAQPVDESLPTVCAGGNHHGMLIPYAGNNGAHHTDDPTRTVTTHDREGLATWGGIPEVEDCRFRMLKPHEIQAAMAFPRDYQVLGTEREKVRLLGNAVTPPVMALLFQRCVETLS